MARKYGVWAVRSGGSVFGAAENWCKHYGKIVDFETFESAADYAQELNRESRSPNVRYSVKEKEPEKLKKAARQYLLSWDRLDYSFPKRDAG